MDYDFEKWFTWEGGVAPVDADVEYVLRDGYEDIASSLSLDWLWQGNDGDIVKYRIATTK